MGSLPPLIEPTDALPHDRLARAARQLLLPGIGLDGQRRLAAARVLVIGAGGLGSPVLHYLAAAGVGHIGIVDFDSVDLSNLQRQVIHQTASVGEPKTRSAARAIAALDPGILVTEHRTRLDRDNALRIMADYDLVIDGSDNFSTRYLASDAAALSRKPYVWGSVLRFDGQVTVFWEGAPEGRSLDYRDLHPVPPAPGDVLSCDEAGVLGTVCATIGSMMATEAVKLITGIGETLLGRVLTFDALGAKWRELRIVRAADRMPVRELVDYDLFCGILPVSTVAADARTVDVAGLEAARADRRLIDVREAGERAIEHIEGDEWVPLDELLADPARAGMTPVVVYCASGKRSARAVQALTDAGVDAVSLEGGIRAWSTALALAPQHG